MKFRHDEVTSDTASEKAKHQDEEEKIHAMRQTVKEFEMMKDSMEKILHDFKTGSLSRVRASTYIKRRAVSECSSPEKSMDYSVNFEPYRAKPKWRDPDEPNPDDSDLSARRLLEQSPHSA